MYKLFCLTSPTQTFRFCETSSSLNSKKTSTHISRMVRQDNEMVSQRINQDICRIIRRRDKVRMGAKIRNRYNQVPHLTQDTKGKVTSSKLDTTNESQEVSPFPAGDHKAYINRRTQRHSEHKTEKKHIKDPQKKYHLGKVSLIFCWRA